MKTDQKKKSKLKFSTNVFFFGLTQGSRISVAMATTSRVSSSRLLLQMYFLDETKLFYKVSELYEAKKDSIHIIQELSGILTRKTAVRGEFSRILTPGGGGTPL